MDYEPTFDGARELMYDELTEEFGEDLVHNLLDGAARKTLTEVYDNQDALRQQLAQAQQ